MLEEPQRVIVTAPVVTSTTAEEFLGHFDVTRSAWEPEPTEWVYRGHGNERWPLRPTAHRADSLEPFLLPDEERYDPAARPARIQQGITESLLLRRFHAALDEAGQPIPTDGELLREALKAMHHNADEAIPTSLEPLVALARHAGVPTRVLDFTRRAKVACYFAAVKAAELLFDPNVERDQKPSAIEVWALRLSFVERFGPGGDPEPAPRLSVVTAPRATNSNLHAQSGVCISQAYGSLAGDLAPLDAIIQYMVDMMSSGRRAAVPLPVLRRFTLPATEAPKLLRLLSYEQITAAHMFPSAKGVVDSLREQRWWDRSPPQRGPRVTGF